MALVRGALPVILALIAAVSLTGCRNAGTRLVLEFPSEETFLASSEARIALYDAGTDAQICRRIIAGEPIDADPLALVPPVDVCDYQQSVSLLEDLGQGLRAIYVGVLGQGEQPILVGCRLFRLGLDEDEVVVSLAVTPDFEANRRPNSCRNAEARCSEDC